mmetsp:Transcript_1180/g.4615  ORF Transcript_1180/g.4615 Transcript_1180/m.4615 type:complete len:207 (+) Transcript_1180:1131-1751(+)
MDLDSLSARMRSSTVFDATNLTARTGRVWPMRWTRASAWSSIASFHHGSTKKAWFARVSVRPWPPHRSETRSTVGEVSASPWKARTMAPRFSGGTAPVTTSVRTPACASSRSRHRASVPMNCENTTTFSPAGTARTASHTAASFGASSSSSSPVLREEYCEGSASSTRSPGHEAPSVTTSARLNGCRHSAHVPPPSVTRRAVHFSQ